MQLPDMFSLVLDKEGPSQCMALVMMLNKGKTNKCGKIQYGAVLRNKDVTVCAINALAMYFFFRWHVSGENFPDMSSKQSWYDIYALKGKDRLIPLAYQTQADPIKRLKQATGCLSYHVSTSIFLYHKMFTSLDLLIVRKFLYKIL